MSNASAVANKVERLDSIKFGKAKPSVSDIFVSLDYGPAPESSMPADGWLDDHERSFGHFIDGKWIKPEGRKIYETRNPCTGLLYLVIFQFLYLDNYHVLKLWKLFPWRIEECFARSVLLHSNLFAQ